MLIKCSAEQNYGSVTFRGLVAAQYALDMARSRQFTAEQQAALFADMLSHAESVVDLDALEEAVSQSTWFPIRVNVRFKCEGGAVLMALQVSDAPRAGSDMCDVIVQTISSQVHNAGHGTQAVLGLVDVARRLGRGVQLQSAVSAGGLALGRRLVRNQWWTERWGSFYSPESPE